MKTNNTILHARAVGALFLMAFFAYGVGQMLMENQASGWRHFGATGVMANSAMIISIGVLLRSTLNKYSTAVGDFYLFIRIFEAIALASIVLNLIPNV